MMFLPAFVHVGCVMQKIPKKRVLRSSYDTEFIFIFK